MLSGSAYSDPSFYLSIYRNSIEHSWFEHKISTVSNLAVKDIKRRELEAKFKNKGGILTGY